jgi:protein-disulfide isomerase
VDTEKVRFLFKDYPINDLGDRASLIAAEASYCAADQGKYWEYHNKVCVQHHRLPGRQDTAGWLNKDSI